MLASFPGSQTIRGRLTSSVIFPDLTTWSMLLVVYTQSSLHCIQGSLHETSFYNFEYETEFTTSCTTDVDKLVTIEQW